jgi:hypothetical protein
MRNALPPRTPQPPTSVALALIGGGTLSFLLFVDNAPKTRQVTGIMERRERDQLLARLRADAERIAGHFGLSYRKIVAEHPRVRSRYGACFSDGLIKIRLNHVKTKRPLKYSSLIDTLCHELAHLRHFDHSPEFQRFFWQLLGWARQQGIYRPSSRRSPTESIPREAPAQLVQRNGVAVFGHEAAGSPPATRWAKQLGETLGQREDEEREPSPRRPRQLSLF